MRLDTKTGRRSEDALVPLHSLYGENSGAVVDFIHIEPLRDRSELYDWSIDAHTHAGLHQVVLLFSGRVRVGLDESTHQVASPAAISIPASVVHSFEYQPHSSGYMLTVADRQLDGSPIGSWLRSRLFETGVTLGMGEGAGLADRLQHLSNEIMKEQATVDVGRVATIDWLTRTVLVLLARETQRVESQPSHFTSGLFREFMSAVEAHYNEQWPITGYAEHLHVSESSLNRLCQSVADTTAFEVVQGRLEVEARRRLTYTTTPIHRVAGDLGFSDASYFARFFRRRTGTSPREFRSKYQTVASSG